LIYQNVNISSTKFIRVGFNYIPNDIFNGYIKNFKIYKVKNKDKLPFAKQTKDKIPINSEINNTTINNNKILYLCKDFNFLQIF
jgi:hypothetical protein